MAEAATSSPSGGENVEKINEVLDIDTAINNMADQIKVQLQSIAVMDSIPDLISIEDNIYENLSMEDAERITMQIKIALITLAAIKAIGFNKKCVDYLLNMSKRKNGGE